MKKVNPGQIRCIQDNLGVNKDSPELKFSIHETFLGGIFLKIPVYKDIVAERKQIGQTSVARSGRINVDAGCPTTRGRNQIFSRNVLLCITWQCWALLGGFEHTKNGIPVPKQKNVKHFQTKYPQIPQNKSWPLESGFSADTSKEEEIWNNKTTYLVTPLVDMGCLLRFILFLFLDFLI